MDDQESEYPSLKDVDANEAAISLTEGYLRLFSRIFERDITAEISDEKKEESVEMVEDFLKEWQEIPQPDEDETAEVEFLMEKIGSLSGDLLDTDTNHDDPLQQFIEMYEEIDDTLIGARNLHEKLGYPNHFDCVKTVSEQLVENNKAQEFLEQVGDEFFEEDTEIFLQMILGHHDQKVQLILEHPVIETSEVARSYIREYVRECEIFKKTIPLVLYAESLLEERNSDLNGLSGKRLGNYVSMVESDSRSKINTLARPVRNDYRNSLAHEDYLIDPINNQIELRNNQGNIFEKLGFIELRDLLVEMICQTHSLTLFYMLVQHDQSISRLNTLEESELDEVF